MALMRLRENGLSSRQVGDDVVLLDMVNSRYLTVSGSGVLLLEELREERTRDELAAALCGAYDVDADTAGRDVDAFVTQLSNAGLLAA
jgi:hypothetical protein